MVKHLITLKKFFTTSSVPTSFILNFMLLAFLLLTKVLSDAVVLGKIAVFLSDSFSAELMHVLIVYIIV